jgi:CheY-like chemotaxis protein
MKQARDWFPDSERVMGKDERGKYANVLVVEDDKTSAFLLQLLLWESDLVESIAVAANGEEALDYLNRLEVSGSTYPELIFLDINMPVMDGFEFLEACVQRNCLKDKEVKIVILSSSAHEKDISRARAFGIQDYLFKPISAEAVLAAVRT